MAHPPLQLQYMFSIWKLWEPVYQIELYMLAFFLFLYQI